MRRSTKARPESPPQRPTSANAYRSDMTSDRQSVSEIDGPAIIVATLADQALSVTEDDAPKMLAEANRMALEVLAKSFPDQPVPHALPWTPEVGPMLALSEAIKDRLPNLSAFLADRLLEICLPSERPTSDAPEPFAGMGRNQIEAAFQQSVDAYNDAPQPALAGLSPNQVFDLQSGDWYQSGPLRLKDDLSPRDLAGSLFVHDARTILTQLADVGPLKATELGSLSRAAVAALLPKLRIRDEYLDAGLKKVINEADLMWLELARILLEGTGFIARRSGTFRITKLGRAIVADDRFATLFVTLFVTLFQRTRLDYLDRSMDDESGLQSTIACTFYLLGKHGGAWQSAGALAERAWMESARDAMQSPPGGYAGYDRSSWVFAARVLRPLVVLGLMEERRTGTKLNPGTEFRVTPLYRRFMRFEFSKKRASGVRFPSSVQ